MTKLKNFLLAYAVFAAFAYVFSAFDTKASVSEEYRTIASYEEKAQEVIMVFQKALKGELMAAMQKGGPKAAVEICNEKAPQIAEKVNLEQGVIISRTSLKVRNPNNRPTDWEKKTLEVFEERQARGETLIAMKTHKFDEEGFTYMKPIPMMGMCAACHGTNISKPLYENISKYYPDDAAIGFKPGDIRGAFVVKIDTNNISQE